MLTAVKNHRSLTFYQPPSIARQSKRLTADPGGIGAVAIAETSFRTAATTSGYNTQLQGFLTKFSQERLSDASRLDLSKPSQNARNRGVQRAWEYERADIAMGGKGSADWTDAQRAEIRERGKVRGAEGHHQKNVADHPQQQADPDNIRFYKSKKTHLEEGHEGKWRNRSDAGSIDKNEMLRRTNSKRVWKNELQGLGIAVAIGAGTGLTIGFVTTLARLGVTPDAFKAALAEGAKMGAGSALLSATGYGLSRTIGEVASRAVEGVLENLGLEITDNISKMVNMGVVGTLTLAVFSTYQFVKLKCHGATTKDALIRVGKQALSSLSILAVSIAAQEIWGGAAGIIVSVGAGIILVSCSAVDFAHQRHVAEKIRVYAIENYYPSFAM